MAKKKEVVITCNATNVKAVIEGLERGMAALAKEEEKLLNTIKHRGYAENDEKKRLKELEKAMDAMRTNVQKNREEQKKLAEVMKDLAGAKLKDLKKALQEGKAALNNMSAKDPGRQKLVNDLKKIQAQIEANTGAIKKQQSAWGSLGTTLKNLVAYAGVFAGFNKLKSLTEEVFKANLKLSDSLANIRKVSGLSMEAINQLYRNIAAIDSRNTIETLNQLAYTGAKLGIGQNYGVEGLTGFVKAAEQVQMALGEDMGEDALPALAKMTEVMGLIDKYGVEQSMQKAASAIFQLGATSTATGTNIVEFSKRLYGLANVSRVSTDDLLALGSAADAMGLMPEVAATAFNKLFTSVQRQHNLIEQTLGMQKGRIKELYDEGKTMDAIVEIFEKMNQKGNLNLLGTVFKDLGSDGARLVNVMATMADRVDILKKHLETSRDAFKEGEAVIGEYMIQNQTAAALVERSSNLWAKAFTNPEGVDMVKQMAQAWYDLSKSMTQSDAQMKSLHVSIDLIALGIQTLIKLLPFLIRGLMLFGVAAAIRGVITGIGGMVTAIRTATTAQIALNTAMKSNWFLAIASGIAAALTLLYDYSKAADEAAERERKRKAELKAAFENSREAVESVIKPLKVYKKALDDANLSEKQKMDMVKQFKNDYQDYLDYLGIEIESAVDLAKAYAQVVKVMKQKKAYEERESFRQQKNGDNRMSRIENQAQVEAQLQSMGITGIDKKWLEQNEHLGTKGVYDKIMRQQYGMGAWEVRGTGRGRWATRDSKGKIKEVGSEALWDIINDYIVSYRTERDTNKQIDAMFNSEYKDIDLEHFNIDEFNDRVQRARWKRKGSLDNEKPDKDAIAAAKKAAQEHKKALKLEMDEAQKASTGIISKLEEYYRLQEAAINDARADGQLTEEQAKEMVRALSIVKNESLATARRAVTTGETKDWDELKTKVLPAVMSDTSEVSRNLLSTIQQVAVDKLHNDLQKFNGSSDVLGLDSRAFFDQMNAKAAGNTREAARLRAKIQNEVERALMQYQFVEKANQQMRKDLEAIGITTETYEQWAKRMQQGIKEKPATVTSSGRSITDQEAYREMGNKFIEQGVINFRYNIENQQEAEQWLNDFATTSAGELEDWAQAFPELVTWIDLIKRKEHGETLGEVELQALQNAMPQIKNLYNEMLNHADRVNKAMKQAYEHEKSQQDIRFQMAGYRKQEEETDKSWETVGKQKDAGIGQTLAEQIGVDKIADDPEIQRIQNRIYWRNQELLDAQAQFEQRKALNEQELQALRDRNATEAEIEALRLQQKQDNAGIEELIKEKQTQFLNETNNLAITVAQQMQKRVQAINTLIKPVTDFTQAAGRKIGDMIFNMESEEATWEQLWKNMALAVGESVIQMGAQYAQNLIMQQAMNKASEAEAVADAGVKVTAGIAAGSAKTIGELGWWGIPLIGVISALLMGLLQSALSTKSSKDGSSSSSSAAATPKTKLVSGMLTYDRGNVERFAGRRKLYDDGETQVYGRRRYLGEDGKVYTATAEPAPKDGLITHPIATTVQGQPALVAENGPEIVIGRETTKAIMMNEPELIKYLANYQQHGGSQGYSTARGIAAYDSGNVQSVAATQPSDISPQTSDAAAERQALINRLDRSDALMEQVLYFLQNPIAPEIAMYDTGGKKGLRSKMKEADRFMARYGG